MHILRVRTRILLGLALVLALVLAFYLPRSSPKDASVGSKSTKLGGEEQGLQVMHSPRGVPKNDNRSQAAKKGPDRPRALAPQERLALLEALEKARAARKVAPKNAKPDATDKSPTRLAIENKTGSTSEWEKRQLSTLSELLGECHSLASAELGKLIGSIGIRFTVTGEPEIGGLLDEVEFMEEYSTIDNATMRECMRESLYALELDPPPEGVAVGREVTLRFDEEE